MAKLERKDIDKLISGKKGEISTELLSEFQADKKYKYKKQGDLEDWIVINDTPYTPADSLVPTIHSYDVYFYAKEGDVVWERRVTKASDGEWQLYDKEPEKWHLDTTLL